MYELARPYLCNLFLTRSDVHDLNTRNKDILHVPQYKTASGQLVKGVFVTSDKDLADDNLKNLPFETFKIKLRDRMLAKLKLHTGTFYNKL